MVHEVNIPNKNLHAPALTEMYAMPSIAAMSEFFDERNKGMIWDMARGLRRKQRGSSEAPERGAEWGWFMVKGDTATALFPF